MKRVVLIVCGLIALIGAAIVFPVAKHFLHEQEIEAQQIASAERAKNLGLSPCETSEKAVRHYLSKMLQNSPEPPIISVWVAPSFSPEHAISITKLGIFRSRMDAPRSLETPNPNVGSEGFFPIDSSLGRRIVEAVSQEVDHSDSPYQGGSDGTAYYFLHGQYCGQTWSPEGITRASRLVDLVNVLLETSPNKNSIDKAIDSVEDGHLK